MGLDYFFIFGCINVIKMTWQDIRNKRMIDDRFNFLMLGVALSVASHTRPHIVQFLILSLYILAIEVLFTRFKTTVGDADKSTFRWMHLGIGLIDIQLLIVFVVLEMLVFLITGLVRKYVIKTDAPQPFYPSILVLWFTMTVLYFTLFSTK